MVIIVFCDLPDVSAKRIVFVGIGKFAKLNAEIFRAFAGRVVKSCIGKKINKISFVVPDIEKTKMEFKALVLPAVLVLE